MTTPSNAATPGAKIFNEASNVTPLASGDLLASSYHMGRGNAYHQRKMQENASSSSNILAEITGEDHAEMLAAHKNENLTIISLIID